MVIVILSSEVEVPDNLIEEFNTQFGIDNWTWKTISSSINEKEVHTIIPSIIDNGDSIVMASLIYSCIKYLMSKNITFHMTKTVMNEMSILISSMKYN